MPLASALPLAKDSSSNWDAAIEISISQDGAAFGNFTPIKAATQRFQAIRARMSGVIYDTETSLRAVRCELHVAAAERDASGTATIDGTGHATVSYAPPFFATPNVQLTPHASGSSGISLVITATTKDGFTVEQRDHTGAALGGGTFDWRAQGHGVSA